MANSAEPLFSDYMHLGSYLAKHPLSDPPHIINYEDNIWGTALYVTDHGRYWERCDEAIAAKKQRVGGYQFALNQFQKEWPDISIDDVKYIMKWARSLTLEDMFYGGARRVLYEFEWKSGLVGTHRLNQLLECLFKFYGKT